MAFQDVIKELQELDVNELSVDNIGSWPLAIKVLVWVLVFVACLAAGYYFLIAEKQDTLAQVTAQEPKLKQDYEDKWHKARNLDAYRKQMEEMEESFGALVSQLPSETEVPGLLEDITNRGVDNGLEIVSIKLQPESAKEFYVELPIEITVVGTYHDLGSFVSGIAGLPRIVTLHDFEIGEKNEGDGRLTMTVTAKTYRYKEEA